MLRAYGSVSSITQCEKQHVSRAPPLGKAKSWPKKLAFQRLTVQDNGPEVPAMLILEEPLRLHHLNMNMGHALIRGREP
jgi:hypothetical protein